jgi:hypothetical protein
MMCKILAVLAALGWAAPYIDVCRPETLGAVCARATSISVFKVEKVNKEKGVILYRKVEDLKGSCPRETFREFLSAAHEPHERQHYLDWVEVGKIAVLFRHENRQAIAVGEQWTVNDGAPPKDESEVWTIGTRTEPWFLKNYCGDPGKLAESVKELLAGKDVIVPVMVGDRDGDLRKRDAKRITVRASLKRQDYNLERDRVEGDGR